LGERPPELLEAYQKQFGPTARELLTQAQKDKDETALAEVARRYYWTKEGREALQALALQSVEREQFTLAALRFEALRRQEVSEPGPEVLFQAARAFRLSGYKDTADMTWRDLERKFAMDELKIGDRSQPLKKWKEELDTEAEKRQPVKMEI